jgi:hypothetical protein
MKKRIYKAPAIQEIIICEYSVICSSIPIVDEEINTGGRVRRYERENWGNFWNKE